MSSQVVTDFLAAWLRQDVDAVLDCLTDDVVYAPAVGPTYEGKEEVGKAMAAEITADLGGIELILDDPVGLGDHVLGGWALATATGEIFRRGVDVYLIRDGKISVKDQFRKVYERD